MYLLINKQHDEKLHLFVFHIRINHILLWKYNITLFCKAKRFGFYKIFSLEHLMYIDDIQ